MPEPLSDVPPIVVEDLRLRYPQDGRVVLHGVNMTLRRGEIKLLLGPSGVGKSSLALCLNGLIPHQMDGEIRGSVLVNGISTQDTTLPALTTQVGMLFQDPDSQIATLTVGDEVAFGMENLRTPPVEMPRRIRLALHRVGLDGMEERSTDALSGGQKQRVALASTLAMGAAIVVFDEPTANLDPAGTANFFGLLSNLNAEGTTILIIEHKLDELVEQVDSIAVMDAEGKIVLDGPPRDVLRNGRALLMHLGVWLPQVTELANALERRGLALEPYPITISEAVDALEKVLHKHALPELSDEQMPPPREEMPPLLEIKTLQYKYPEGEQALCDISLSIAIGDMYAIVGPNGSGKTTLAKHMVGLLKPQHGSIELAGRDIARMRPEELNRRVAYVFQNPEHQFVALTVFDELAFSLRALKLPEAEVAARVEGLMSEFGLEQHRGSNPFTLSQGQKRRLSVATMLALDPQVLILDEPTFGQDREYAKRIMEHLAALCSRGIAVVLITHDMKLVAHYATKVAALVVGRVRYEGSVLGLYEDGDLVREADLEVPPLYKVARSLQRVSPDFPLLMTVEEFVEAICAYSGTGQAAASYMG